MTPDRIKTQEQAYFDRLSAHDADGWVALHTEEAFFVDPVSDDPFVGHDALRAFFDEVGGMSSELAVTDIDVLMQGPNTAAVRWTANPTLATSGATAQWPCITTFHFNDEGLIRHAIVCWDHEAAIHEARRTQ